MGYATKSAASTSLAPGFRFHPTDEELVSYYLKRKISGKPFRFDAISEIDIYKVEPWDLPGLSKLKSRDQEWYFFSYLDRKYGNGSRTNRATYEGYWKTTGKDRTVHHSSRVVGMKKTLVYHQGRAPHGKRSNWVMHEYRLVDETLQKTGSPLDGVVLCRIFHKSGVGPKSGEKYGAPFIEEEWENDDVESMLPGDVSFEEPFVDNEAFIEQNDLDQKLELQLPRVVPAQGNHHDQDNNICVEDFGNIVGYEEKLLAAENEHNSDSKVLEDQKLIDLPSQVENMFDMVNEQVVHSKDITDGVSTNCLANGTSSVDVSDATFDDGVFLDAIDFLDSVEENALDFGAIGPCLEDDFDISQYLSFDSPPELMPPSDANLSSTKEIPNDGALELPSSSQHPPELPSHGIAPSSQHVLDFPKSKPSTEDTQYPFLGQAGRLLGNIPAPPAFASEFPTKDLASRLYALQSSNNSMTAGMVRIPDMAVGRRSTLQWSVDKTGYVNVLVSFDLPHDVSHRGLGSLSSVISSKIAAGFYGGCSRLMLLCVFAFAVSFKIGACIYAK